jgi:thioredoxin-dependent peroxiredoxin
MTTRLSKSNRAWIGEPAPDFTLQDTQGKEWRLAESRGHVVALLFYSGDETPVCTRQMCSLRDRWQDYKATGAEVVGVSANTVESHKKFAEHHHLPLRLLADTGGKVSKLYDAMSIFPGRTARSVFVIDANGIIRYRDVRRVGLFRPKDEDIIAAIRAAQ